MFTASTSSIGPIKSNALIVADEVIVLAENADNPGHRRSVAHVGQSRRRPTLLGYFHKKLPSGRIMFWAPRLPRRHLRNRLSVNGFDCNYSCSPGKTHPRTGGRRLSPESCPQSPESTGPRRRVTRVRARTCQPAYRRTPQVASDRAYTR